MSKKKVLGLKYKNFREAGPDHSQGSGQVLWGIIGKQFGRSIPRVRPQQSKNDCRDRARLHKPSTAEPDSRSGSAVVLFVLRCFSHGAYAAAPQSKTPTERSFHFSAAVSRGCFCILRNLVPPNMTGL